MIALILVAGLAAGDVYQEIFSQANAAYEAGDFQSAAQGYEQLAAAGVVSPELFFNLANAHYRQGRIGLAILNYERALRLTPGFDSARDNLGKALRETVHNLGRPAPPAWEQSLFFWHDALSFGAVRAAAIVCWVVFWTLLALRLWRPLPYLRRIAALACLLALAFSGSAYVKAHPEPLAVIVSEKAEVRHGKSGQESVRFELFEGDRVLIDRREDGWARVEKAGGERGWVRDTDVVLVGPPFEFQMARQDAAHHVEHID